MKKIYSFLALILFAGSVRAQLGMGKPEDIEQVQQRKLIVITEQPEQEIVDYLTKKNQTAKLESYKACLQRYNENMKAVVEKFWPYASNGVEYKTYDEVQKLKKANNKNYAVLYCFLICRKTEFEDINTVKMKERMGTPRQVGPSSQFVRTDGMNQVADIAKKDEGSNYNGAYCKMFAVLIENFGGMMPVGAATLPDIVPTKADIIFGINSIKIYFDYRTVKKTDKEAYKQKTAEYESTYTNLYRRDASKLKNMTLLIRKDMISESLSEADLKKYYPYPFKIYSKEELDDLFLNSKVPANSAWLVDMPDIHHASQDETAVNSLYIYDATTFMPVTLVEDNLGKLTQKCLEKLLKGS